MHETLLNTYGIKQLGYYVENLEEAAQAFADTLGAGPFFDLGVSEPTVLEYRGAPSTMRSRCALGQLGNMQIELIEVQTDEPDVYKDLGHYGLHHLCIWVDDSDEVARQMNAQGFETVMFMESGAGLRVYYFDCRETLGSFLEVNAPIEQLWQGIKAQADTWDGTRPLRTMADLMGR